MNAEHLALARERTPNDGGVEYLRANLAALLFGDDSFDAIYSERVFQHLHNPDAAMSELFRVLRPGGRIVVADADHLATVVDADDREVAEQVQTASAGGIIEPRRCSKTRTDRFLAVLPGYSVMGDKPLSPEE